MSEIIHCKSKQHVIDKFIKALKLELFVKHTSSKCLWSTNIYLMFALKNILFKRESLIF